jgi:hypothetical protein
MGGSLLDLIVTENTRTPTVTVSHPLVGKKSYTSKPRY